MTDDLRTEGYPLGFGDKYGRRFKEPAVYNLNGKQFIDCTRKCLIGLVEQQSTTGSVRHEPNATCGALKKYAWKTHVKCYRLCGLSDIRYANAKVVLKTYDSKDVLSVKALKQFGEVAHREWMGPIVAG